MYIMSAMKSSSRSEERSGLSIYIKGQTAYLLTSQAQHQAMSVTAAHSLEAADCPLVSSAQALWGRVAPDSTNRSG